MESHQNDCLFLISFLVSSFLVERGSCYDTFFFASSTVKPEMSSRAKLIWTRIIPSRLIQSGSIDATITTKDIIAMRSTGSFSLLIQSKWPLIQCFLNAHNLTAKTLPLHMIKRTLSHRDESFLFQLCDISFDRFLFFNF